MEVNKEQAEKCRDLGAAALRRGEFPRAAKMLQKSLQLYPLPGVEALYQHAIAKQRQEEEESNSNNSNGGGGASRRSASNSNSASSNNPQHDPLRRSDSSMGADGRAYTAEQAEIVQTVLKAKEGGRGAHYRVLSIRSTANEAEIKKAYRKLSLKVHPDKNSAPHADEAFKAVGLAYATLSDAQKRTIYDRYGEEDPDNRGGGGGGVHMRRRGGGGVEMTPEEIFNAFFGGGMPGGGMGGGPGGVHFYSAGFGPGMHFRGGGIPRQQRARQAQQQQQQEGSGFGTLVQLLPLIMIMLVSFFSSDTTFHNPTARSMPGENQYFSLTNKPPFTNPLKTRLSKVEDIPYFVSDKFLRTYARDRYQLSQVERMVEKAYENYLVHECTAQQEYQKRLFRLAEAEKAEEARQRKMKQAREFVQSRCEELTDLFPNRQKKKR